MNVLGLVFSIIIILSFGYYACLEKQSLARKVDKTFTGQAKTSRYLLSQYESESYKQLRAAKKMKTQKQETKQKPKKKQKKTEAKKPPAINPECARLNLWPLLEKGRDAEPFLYEQTASLLRTFYKGPLFHLYSEKAGFEYRFLDAWIQSIKVSLIEKPDGPITLEKMALKDPSMQRLYYNMLRGAKEKYPSLLDFVKAEQTKDGKICLFHATPQLLSVFFGAAAQAIYDEMHSDKMLVTEDAIEDICRSHRYNLFDKKIFTLLDVGRAKHKNSSEMTLFEEDSETHISLRKKVHLPKS